MFPSSFPIDAEDVMDLLVTRHTILTSKGSLPCR